MINIARETKWAGIGGHLISRECGFADWQHSRHCIKTMAHCLGHRFVMRRVYPV
jgi:hypothetical protein